MKLTKLAYWVMAATFAAGAYGAKAAPATTTTDNSKLTVALTIKEQVLSDTNSSGDHKTYIWTTKNMKIGNKELLSLLAKMFNTNWPTGAQLEMNWASSPYHVIVADKSGTNILFDCASGVDDTNRYAYLTLDLFDYSGPLTQKKVNAAPGSYVWTAYYRGYLRLHYDLFSDSSANIDLYGYGQNIRKGVVNWNAGGVGTWTVADTFTPVATGEADYETSIMTGTITAKRKGIYYRY